MEEMSPPILDGCCNFVTTAEVKENYKNTYIGGNTYEIK